MFYWIILGLFFLTVMETVLHHFERSIFIKIKSKFWYKFFESNWRNKYTETLEKKKGLEYLIALIDAYHISKWGMILSFALALGIEYVPVFAVSEWVLHYLFYKTIWIK